MNKLIAAVALATVLASPAFAQSYDPDLGTGNIAAQIETPASRSGAQDAYAQVRPGAGAAVHRLNGHGGARLQSPYAAYGAVTPFGSPALDRNDATAARAAAIRACSAIAAPYKEMTWGHMGIHQYRTCMTQHGQAE
jgi:hypothetical protein